MQQLVSKVVTKEEFLLNKSRHYELILDGALFVYPTDTIYGIGCNALDNEAVEKIRELKGRPESPFSVIVPSKEWIQENLEVTKQANEWLAKLPGPYTLIMKMKKQCVAPGVTRHHPQPTTHDPPPTLGVRMPKHWIQNIAAELGVPIVTTSVNKAGEPFMTSVETMDDSIRDAVECIVDEGEKNGRPSQIVFLDKEMIEVQKR